MFKKIAFASFVLFACVALYAEWPSTPLPNDVKADRVVVTKSQRKLVLLQQGKTLKEYHIALGRVPDGRKQQEGDGKTPEGQYTIDYRKPDSAFHFALHISYPNEQDSKDAAAKGASPGGLIMIHGMRNGLGFIGNLHRLFDWTNGCIAVTDREIEEIARAVDDGTPIEINP